MMDSFFVDSLKRAAGRLYVGRFLIALALSGLAGAATAATNIYGIRGNTVAGANNIIRIDSSTGAATTVYANYPGGNAATIAQCPNGLIYYAINGGTNQLYVFNPQTPLVMPATLGAGLPDGALKMACSPGGVLYYLTETVTNNLHIISTATGAYTGAVVTVTGAGAGGDIAFNSVGTLYGFNNTNNLFTINTATGVTTPVGAGAVTGLNGAGIGFAFDAGDNIRVLTNGGPNFYSVNTGGATPSATSIATLPGGASTGDLASINVPNPDLSITKTDGKSVITPGDPVIYTIVVSNASVYAVTGTVTDVVPATVTGVTWTCVAAAGSNCASASGSGNNVGLDVTLAASGTATITVSGTLSPAATGTLTNTATVALPFPFMTDATPANNTAIDTDTIVVPSLVNLKTVQVTSDPVNGASNPKYIPGAAALYTIRITNQGAGTVTSNSVFIVDPVPANTELFVGDLGAVGSGPIVFIDGSPSSGLTYTFTSLASAADDVEFSNDGGATYVYTPVPNGQGYDSAVTHIRVKPKGVMAGNTIAGSPTFDLRFRVRVK